MVTSFRLSRRWCFLLTCCLWWALPAQAVNYTFPGSMPSGCSGSSGTYTCGSVTLANADTVTINSPKPATIIATSFTTNGAKINQAGTAADLTIQVINLFHSTNGAVVNANVTAGYISSSGTVSYGGSLTATSTYVSMAGPITVGGSISAKSYVFIGYNATRSTINGSISAETLQVDVYNSDVNGSMTAGSYINLSHGTSVTGHLTALGTYVDIHDNATIGGAIKAASYVHMTTNSSVGGNVTAKTTIALGSGSTVAKCVRSTSAGTITLPSAGAVGGACCGEGSTCTSTCVSGTPKPAACAWPDSGLMAEYRFEESSYNGTDSEVLDSSGNNRHGKVVGGTSSTASGKICRGIFVPKNLTSAIDAFDTGIDANAVGNSGTIAFWYKSVTSGNEHRMLYDATLSAGGKFYLYRDDDGSGVDLNGHITDGGGTVRDVDKLNAFSDATWAHIALTWKFTTGSHTTRMVLYVNGVEQDTQTYSVTSGKIADAISTIYFGDNRSASSVELNSANGYIDQIKIYDAELNASQVSAVYAESPTCLAAGPHHVRVTTSSATGPSCTPVTYTVQACANESCSSPYTTGLSGNLVLSGSPTVNYTSAFTIAPGSSTTTVAAHITSAGNVTAGLSGLSATPTAGSAPYCGIGAAASAGGSCVYTATDSALLFDVLHHEADTSQAITVSAVRSTDNATVCAPAFASVSKDVTFKCSYSNPTSGTLPVRIGGTALNASNSSAAACDVNGRAVSLSFNSNGVASTTVQYADAGQMGLSATYTGAGSDAGLAMSGSDTFIAAPANLLISGVTAGSIAAGAPFSATVTARNSSGATTRNFGQETSPASVALAFTKYRPIGTAASSGAFSGSLGAFSNGVATASNLAWSEVGSGDINASIAGGNYLGSGFAPTGSTGSVGAAGPFVAHHFTTEEIVQGCGSFTYSGQPFGLKVYARNANGSKLLNYDGTANTSPNFAKTVVLSGVGLTGALSNASVAASSFNAGVATVSTPTFTFTNKLSSAGGLTLRATDANANSDGYTEASAAMRSGRVRLSNAFGSEKTALQIPVQTEYWSGSSWVLNNADSCTVIPANAVALSNYTTYQGTAAAWTTTASSVNISGGNGVLTLTAPSPSLTGTVDLALNLSSTSADNACLGTHPSTTGAALTWLRSRNGNCASTYDKDPSARATFGIYTPESRRMIHVRPIH